MSKVQEPFKLTLLAVPKDYMKDDTCYETVNMTVKKNENHTLGDIHQYMQTYRIPKVSLFNCGNCVIVLLFRLFFLLTLVFPFDKREMARTR